MDEILAAYEASLRSDHMESAADESDVQRHLDHARGILARVVSEMRHATGATAAVHSVHTRFRPDGLPYERAGDFSRTPALFDAAVHTLLGGAGETGRESTEDITGALSLLHRRIVERQSTVSRAHLDSLLEQAGRAKAEERRRIARELHDEVAGYLGSALNLLDLHDLYRDSHPDLARQRLDAARDTIVQSLGNLRDVMSGLRPLFSPEPLRTALTKDLEAMGGAHPPDLRVSVVGDESWLPAGVAKEVYLIVREAQRNAVRHARASAIKVEVRIEPDRILASVEDDGVGFDPGPAPPQGHGGLLSMRERAELLGGSVVLESWPGGGCRVLIRLLLKGERSGRHA
ncbi:sensor histidine kinase [Streptomyces poonensis]|uniref:sensor histidine kinase n=1 Tax=Streptomyces poonensis TaxID=68255 RepID=UPI00167B4246|nr:sensor histidine kinase [Streptomyces poonensis]